MHSKKHVQEDKYNVSHSSNVDASILHLRNGGQRGCLQNGGAVNDQSDVFLAIEVFLKYFPNKINDRNKYNRNIASIGKSELI